MTLHTCSNDSISHGTLSCHFFGHFLTSARAVLELGGGILAMALIKFSHTGFKSKIKIVSYWNAYYFIRKQAPNSYNVY